MIKSRGYAAQNATSPLEPFAFERREVGEHDVLIDILYCGVCHSDIHLARNEWGVSMYPMVPGHEIIGKVKQVGSKVTKFKEGDIAGVGCMVDSCQSCESCNEGLEQFCHEGFTATYNGIERDGQSATQGGYSNNIVVKDDFVLKVSSKLDIKRTAPLFCAGITTYSPLKRWGVSAGQKVGIVGLGGLGHMAVKFAHAFGAHVVVFSRSEHKRQDALDLGANEVVISTDPERMAKQANSFDLILDTVSAQHNVNAYLQCLKRDGRLVFVGVPEQAVPLQLMDLIIPRRQIVGSLTGGLPETQEMLDFCAEHNILPEVEIIPIQDINKAYERTLKADVKYRFVIDMSSLEN